MTTFVPSFEDYNDEYLNKEKSNCETQHIIKISIN